MSVNVHSSHQDLVNPSFVVKSDLVKSSAQSPFYCFLIPQIKHSFLCTTFFKIYVYCLLFIYLTAPDLHGSTWNHMPQISIRSLVVPWPGIEPCVGSRVLATGLPGKSLHKFFDTKVSVLFSFGALDLVYNANWPLPYKPHRSHRP